MKNNFFQLATLAKYPELFQSSSLRTIQSLGEVISALNIKNYVLSEQIHDKNIFLAENISAPAVLSGYDSFITQQKELALIVKTADCAPVFLYDPLHQAIGMVHAGRKGTRLQITELTVKKMQAAFNSQPVNMIAAIGPAICSNCYQIDPYQDIHFDLWSENFKQLVSAGLLPNNIEIAELCPACNAHDRFYSYRKEKTKLRTYNLLMLKSS